MVPLLPLSGNGLDTHLAIDPLNSFAKTRASFHENSGSNSGAPLLRGHGQANALRFVALDSFAADFGAGPLRVRCRTADKQDLLVAATAAAGSDARNQREKVGTHI